MSNKLFRIEIVQSKFDKLFRRYEDGFKRDGEKKIKPSSLHTDIFDWEKLTQENLKIAQKVIKITLDFLQLQPVNRLTEVVKISLQKFENEQVYSDDISGVLNRVDSVKVTNAELLYQIKEYQRTRVVFPSSVTAFDENELPDYLPSKEELKSYVFLKVSSLDGLRRVQDLIDKKLKINPSTAQEIQTKQEPSKFVISVKDRKILVNEYLIGKPHAVGINFEFFEYVRSQPKNTKIRNQDIPDTLRKNKSFTKILNELGFKAEILKAFFPKRGKSVVVYNGGEISKEDLVKIGVKIPLFLKQLEVAHIKNNPE
ncbi:MAG: hypothetical protein AAB581_00495 [Patescibacteria group bacterium]